MRRIIFTLLALAVATAVSAQEKKEYPKPEAMRPAMTEFWTPQPKVVKPGDAATCSAPSDAIVLFDGSNLSAWKSSRGGDADWVLTMTFILDPVWSPSRRWPETPLLHIEWCVPENITGTSQGRGNSGVFLQDKYEIQILDNYGNETYANGQAGSVYKQVIPMANAMRKPGEWNAYDIIYNAPVFNDDGTYKVAPTVTVIQNGVLLLNNFVIRGTTEYIGHPRVVPHGDGPIRLQMHGDPSEPISFRNIWIREF